MGKKSVRKNYILNVSYQVFSLLTPLITTPYISRVLGVSQIGDYSYASSIVSYFILIATLGTTIYGQREISYYQNEKEERSISFWSIEIISLISSLISLILYIALIGVFSKGQHILFLILALNIINVALDISWLYQGMEDFSTVVLRNVFIKVVYIGLIFVFVRSKSDFITYVLLTSFLTVLGSVSLWFGLKKYVGKVRISDLKIIKNIPELLLLFIPTIATTLYNQMDKTMIGMLSSDGIENGYYEQAHKISKMTLTVVTALGTVMLPRIGSFFHDHEIEKIKGYLNKSICFVTFIGCPISCGLIAIASNFIPWFLGFGYEGSIRVLQILSLYNIIVGYSNVCGMQYLVPTGNQNKLTVSVFAGAGINLMLNAILIPHYYAVGAAIASVISELGVTVIQMFYMKDVFKIKDLVRHIWKYYLSSIIMMILVMMLNRLLGSSLVHTILLIIIGVIIYFLCLFVLRDDYLKEVVSQLKARRRS